MTASWKRAAAGAVAFAFAAAALMPLPAHATTPVDGNIVERNDASITIHKFESGSLIGSPINADTSNAQGDGIKGVEFKLHKIDANLLTPEGWDKIKAAKNVPADACGDNAQANWAVLNGLSADSSFASRTVTTQEQGRVQATGLKTGAYLICEGSAAQATNEAGHAVNVVKKAAPFIVTVPTQHPAGHGWLYDINVYPKNTVVEAPVKEMEAVKDGLGVDKGVKISITGKVPNLAEGEYFKHFALVDPMVMELLYPKDYRVTLTKGTTVTELTYVADYLVDYGDPDSTHKNMVAVNLTAQGLQKLRQPQHVNAAIKLEFYATMSAVPQTGGFVNKGYIYTDKDVFEATSNPHIPVHVPAQPGGKPTEKPGVPQGIETKNTVKMNWAPLKISKHDANAINAKLANAEFKIYAAGDGDEANCTAGSANKATKGEAISVNVNGQVIDTFKTEQDGTITIPGLFIDKASADNPGTPTPKTKRCFVLVETKAPAGYVLPAGDNAKFKVLASSDSTVIAEIANTQIPAGDIPALPLTGALGQVLLTVGGVVLMGGAVAFYLVARRRREAKA